MSTTTKKNKSKTLSIRLYDEAYEFIEKKAKEKKVSKSDFLMGQIDPNSEFKKFLESDFDRILKEKEELEAEYKQYRDSSDKDVRSMLEESDDNTILALYKGDHGSRIKKIFKEVAKKRGLILPR